MLFANVPFCAPCALHCLQAERAMYFGPDNEFGFHRGLLFELRAVMCGIVHESLAQRSACTARVSLTSRLGRLRGDFGWRDATVCRAVVRVCPIASTAHRVLKRGCVESENLFIIKQLHTRLNL